MLQEGNNNYYLNQMQRKMGKSNFDQIADKYASNLGDVNKEVVEFIKNENRLGNVTGDAAKKFAAQTSVSAKFGAVLKNIGGTITSMLTNAAVSFGVSFLFSSIVQGIQNVINSNKLLAESAQEVSSKFNEQKTQLEDYRQKITQLKTIQESSASTTEEVKDATAQLYTIQNDLIGTYGSYHQGIDLVNKDLETQLGLLKDINQNNAQKALDEINSIRSAKSSGRNVLFNLGESSLIPSLLFGSNYGKKYNDQLNSGDNWWQAFKNTATGTDIFGEDRGFNKYGDSVSQINDMVNKFDGSLKTTNKTVIQLAKNFDDAFEVDADGVIHYVGNIYEINDAVTRLRVQLKNLGITDEEVFNQLSNTAAETQKRITAVGDSYNTMIEGEIYDNQSLTDSYNTLINIHDKYLAAQEEADPEKVKEIGDEYVDAFAKISESGIDDKYVDFFRDLYPELQGLISEWEFEVKIKPTFNDLPKFENGMTIEDYLKTTSAEELKTQYNRASKNRGKNGLGGWFNILESAMSRSGFDDFGSFIDYTKSRPEYSDGMQIIRERMGKNWKDEFEEEFAKYDLTAALSIKPKPGDMEYTKEEIEDFFNPIEVELEIDNVKDSAAVKSLNDLESDWSGLDTVYESTVNTSGTADAKDIESVNSSMGGVSKAGDEDINALTNALEAYNTALVENKGNAEAAQEAVDKLATAYVDQSGILENLDEENKDYYVDMLKTNGVTNAEEVVMSRLSKQAKETAKALKSLSQSLVDNYDILKQGKSADGYDEALTNVQGKVKSLLSVYDESGNVNEALTPEINEEFITKNLEDIKAATEGDVEALQKLRMEVAALNAEKAFVDVGLPYDVVQGEILHIMDMVAQADAMDIEVGSYIDDSQFLAALAEMMTATAGTADAIGAAFESMGYEVEWTPKKTEAIIPEMLTTQGSGNTNIGAMRTSALEMNVPELKIKRSSKNAASKVNYSGAPKTSSTSGNSGNTGGDKDKTNKINEDTKEEFDWIQVYIQRLEEAISRLDKKVNDTYSNWKKRNKALDSEITDVTKEIKAQEKAQKRYLSNAKKLKLGDVVKAPNKEDYSDNEAQYNYDEKQYKEALSEWESGKYQKLIQEGKLGKGDIEFIENKYLVEIINAYKEIYQKAVDAGDAVQDLKLKSKDLNKQNFDNITQQFENLTTTIEKKVDMIQKKIDYTQTKGYFVDASYYKKQKALYNQRTKDLIKERDKHIAALNKQLELGEDNGGVDYLSEKWYEMLHQIMDDNAAIAETKKEIADLNNQVRQLQWDNFDYLREKLDDIIAESEYLQEILTSEKTMDDYGYYNDRGWANASMVMVQYQENQRAMQEVLAERVKLEKQIAKDENNKDLKDRWQTLTDEARNYAKAIMQAKDAMKQLVEESINTHLSKLKELMDEYKETLSAAKDLYDWQKNVANQTETITKLRKQLTAYESDDSEAARKRRIELRNQLNQAEQQLQETEWDRYISETGKMLDNLYEDYEDILNARFDNIDSLLEDEIKAINDNKTSVSNGLKEIADKYGVPIDRLKQLTDTGDNTISKTIEDIHANLTGKVKDMQNTIKNGVVEGVEAGFKDVVVDEKTGKVSMGKSSETSAQPQTKGGSTSKSATATQTTTQATSADKYANMSYSMLSTLKSNYEDQLHSLKTSEEKAQKIFNILAGEKDKTNAEIAEYNRAKKDLENYRAQIASINTEIALITRNMLKKKAKGYASGSRSISSNQLAWTQEDGTELIFRTSDGAILTPLNQGDMVFTNEMTQRLWDIAKSGIVPITTASNLPNTSGSARAITTNNQIEITLPNVQDYSSFKKELQNDNNFEKFIQEVTVGQLRGNNTLNKRKY